MKKNEEIKTTKIEETAGRNNINISLWIDNYDDIFSDFDPRPYNERDLSDDFLTELKKFSREKKTTVTGLSLLVPKAVRNAETESVISKRLSQLFKKNHHSLIEQKKTERQKGIMMIVIGIVLMILSSYISMVKSANFFMHTLLVLTEPAGWFMLWTGLDIVRGSATKLTPELNFYSKLIKSKINFVEY